MRIAIIGAGFTGLSAGLELIKSKHRVTIFDQNNQVGGLAVGFHQSGWDWTIEKFYHHIFTNDATAISLARSLGLDPIFFHPNTSVYHSSAIYPFNSVTDLLRFPKLGSIDKIRMGLIVAAFKIIPNGRFLESFTACRSLRVLMGTKGFSTIWEPLLINKFHDHAAKVNLAWFWARIKKRTPRLGTFPGGFQAFANKIATEFTNLGGQIILNSKTSPASLESDFDLILSTSAQATPQVDYLSSHVLLLEMDQPFLKDVYWLNILDRSFPFLVTAEHTNFVHRKHFAGKHLLYVGNYLPPEHPLFSLDSTKLFAKYLPYLKKINPLFSAKQVVAKHLFTAPYAQPVMTVNYSQKIPSIRKNKHFYLANQSMIYPWDRGVNYAIELGQKVASEMMK